MLDHEIMQLILCILLLLSGFICVLRITMHRAGNRVALPATALLIIYVLLSGAFCLIIFHFAGAVMLQMALILLMTCAMGAASLQRLSRCQSRRTIVMAAFLILWLLATLLITFLGREPRDVSNILLEFDALSDMISRHSFDPISHLLLNVLLFIPLGVLLPLTDTELSPCWLETLAASIYLTALIESMQLIFQRGQADVEDLLANALGALLGHLICYLFLPRHERT